MPAWAIQLVKLAIQIGSPWIMEQVKKVLSKLSPQIVDIINEFIDNLKNPGVDNAYAKKLAKKKIKAQCEGIACPPETK